MRFDPSQPASDSSVPHDSMRQPTESGSVPGQMMPYHTRIANYLKTEEKELWNWYASNPASNKASQSQKVDLLKSAYRLDRDTSAELYQLAETLRNRMGLSAPVTLYQAQNAIQLTAGLVWVPDELHVVLSGPMRDVLTSEQLSAVLVHEFAHFELFTRNDGEQFAVDSILAAMTNDRASDKPHERTIRSLRLWTELYCDRRAAEITENIGDCVSALVRIETGIDDVNPEAYLTQVREILGMGPLTSEGLTHPEVYIRAAALDFWKTDPATANDFLIPIVEGPLALCTLDLLQQQDAKCLTCIFVKAFLAPSWIQTSLIRSHARRFLGKNDNLPSVELPRSADDLQVLCQSIEKYDNEFQRYLCYVLLDFSTCDPDLEEGPLAAAFLFTEQTGLLGAFRSIAAKELRLGKRALKSVESNAEKIVRAAQKVTEP